MLDLLTLLESLVFNSNNGSSKINVQAKDIKKGFPNGLFLIFKNGRETHKD